MSDESSRSARPYGQRRNDGAPTWWAALDRTDLPDNEVEPSAQRRWYEEAEPAAPQAQPASQTHRTPFRRRLLVGLLIALAIACVAGIAFAVDAATGAEGTVMLGTLLVGTPVALAAAVAIFVARRSS
jgi:hypothetical protein